ncbi:MAG: helicase-associated domain-containing protein [Chloroflexota bacterium]|nr:helicase-associated domain-containing protein [Chloroflexota bacterium]
MTSSSPDNIIGRTSEKMNQRLLEGIFDQYTSAALQKMVRLRNLPITNKKPVAIKTLAQHFYEEKYIKFALSQLGPGGRELLARLKQQGGIMNLQTLRQQVNSYTPRDVFTPALREVMGGALAFYANLDGDYLRFEGNTKHELEEPGFWGGNIVLWSPSQITDLLTIDATLEALLQPAKLQVYTGNEPPQLQQPARFEALLADIFAFSRYLELNKVKILQSGDIGKRDFVKLNEQMTVKESTSPTQVTKLSELGWLSFIWCTMIAMGLAKSNSEDRAVVDQQQASTFYTLPRYEQARQLVKAWVNSRFNDFLRIPTLTILNSSPESGSVPHLSQAIKARELVLKLFQETYNRGELSEKEQAWFDFNSLTNLIKQRNFEFLIPRTKVQTPFGNSYSYGPGYFGVSYYSGFTSKIKSVGKGKSNLDPYSRDSIQALSLDSDWDYVEGEWVAEVLSEPLNWLGIIELGLNQQQRPVAFRFTALGISVLSGKTTAEEQALANQLRELANTAPELARPLLVQPNFDIMVLAPLQNLALLRLIDRFANQVSMGDVAMYRINKETILRGFRGGLDATTILSVLNEHSRVPVAQNIEASVRGWDSEFGRLVVRQDATLLEVADPALLDQLMVDSNLASQIVRRYSPTIALVASDKAEAFIQALGNWQRNQHKKPPSVLNTGALDKGVLTFGSSYTIQVKRSLPYLFYRLGQFADLESWDEASQKAVFKLSAASIKRGRTFGQDYSQISSTLRHWLSVKEIISTETLLALKGWTGYYGETALKTERVIALQASSSAILDDIFSVPRFQLALANRATPTIVLVKEAEFEQLRGDLESLGLNLVSGAIIGQAPPPVVAPTSPGFIKPMINNPTVVIPTITPPVVTPIVAPITPPPSSTLLSPTTRSVPLEEDSGPVNPLDILALMASLGEDLLKDKIIVKPGQDICDIVVSDFVFKDVLLGDTKRSMPKPMRQEIQRLATLPPTARKEWLLELALLGMRQPSPEERQVAVDVLSLMSSTSARRMTELLYDPEPTVRYNACLVLANAGDRESLQVLQMATEDNGLTRVGSVSKIAKYAIAAISNRYPQ